MIELSHNNKILLGFSEKSKQWFLDEVLKSKQGYFTVKTANNLTLGRILKDNKQANLF